MASDEVVEVALKYVPDDLKTQVMCERTVEDKAETLEHVSDDLKTQRLCERAVVDEPDVLRFVPDHQKA